MLLLLLLNNTSDFRKSGTWAVSRNPPGTQFFEIGRHLGYEYRHSCSRSIVLVHAVAVVVVVAVAVAVAIATAVAVVVVAVAVEQHK